MIIFFLFFSVTFPFDVPGNEADKSITVESKRVAIVISREIRPFMTMVNSLESALKHPVNRFFIDDKGIPYGRSGEFKVFKSSDFSAVVAVGPQALSYLVTNSISLPIIYGMVLNPDKIIGKATGVCGVSLNIFSLAQFVSIRQIMPSIIRIGIIYNPVNNQELFTSAKMFAKFAGIELIPLKVKDRSEISLHFKKKPSTIDAILFIPDTTVISKTLIRYIIKQALMYKIPTIGYNRFFYEEGSVLSFDIKYSVVGKQVAKQVQSVLLKKECHYEQPECKMILNEKVVKALNLKIAKPVPDNVEVN